ncbi:MAG: glutamine-hydrolyzing carbamoyl-phosphate synthase small subunit [Desulfovibrio sp.]|uniref:glutamine-hydrolyzing carbamoyl-phosphate synthase small subunit n=1 Tax=Desulfovibrio sp. TaxID=885 RepID=UPI001A6C5D28|nr:glutamine-hydrolyzing carbamoyl-phosphate synthase small subunit [Desulfovibrio sp.]MBD5418006.1 glutamine-hydrolyzing carbamoyl-phosphate synthase small subunit [Desulfovibrio sp.]
MKAVLVLEDGFALEGQSFTGDFETGGEVIFTTGMTGYQEVLTDPSYTGQMVCMTYPLMGNYGITAEDMESAGIHAEAFLVKECCKQPSNWRSTMSLPDFLMKHGTPGVEGLDTRALTRHLRLNGAMRGIISTREKDKEALRQKALGLPTMKGRNLVPRVAATEPYAWYDNAPQTASLGPDGSYAWRGTGLPLIVYDYGIKWNILRHLVAAGFEPLAVPPGFSPQAVRATGARAVFLSNGPGDPATLGEEIGIVRELCRDMPVTGICLGHQIISHALGAHTEKLKFGHHGCNHPVKDLTTGKIEISSQNHGFHVVLDGVADVEATHVNLNDHTLEGLRHKKLPIMSLQYHPEAAAGPRDGNHLFHRFREMIGKATGN